MRMHSLLAHTRRMINVYVAVYHVVQAKRGVLDYKNGIKVADFNECRSFLSCPNSFTLQLIFIWLEP